MVDEKYALLDTDFISKMHMIRKDDQSRLIDKIMAMPNYRFYCHKQIHIELSRHNIAGATEWFESRLRDKSIYLYDDEMIMKELSDIYGELAVVAYQKMLKDACDAYKDSYYEDNFIELSKLDNPDISQVDFLEKLKKDCNAIGEGKNLGELKSYVLLQMLHIKFGRQIYVFCSDDKNARNGIIAIGDARCISVLSSFIRLQKELCFNREEAEPYIRSYMNFCIGKSQTTFKIQEATKEGRMCRIPCEQVFEEMFQGKIDEMKTGNLRYKE
jgi:hypothetical protein